MRASRAHLCRHVGRCLGGRGAPTCVAMPAATDLLGLARQHQLHDQAFLAVTAQVVLAMHDLAAIVLQARHCPRLPELLVDL